MLTWILHVLARDLFVSAEGDGLPHNIRWRLWRQKSRVFRAVRAGGRFKWFLSWRVGCKTIVDGVFRSSFTVRVSQDGGVTQQRLCRSWAGGDYPEEEGGWPGHKLRVSVAGSRRDAEKVRPGHSVLPVPEQQLQQPRKLLGKCEDIQQTLQNPWSGEKGSFVGCYLASALRCSFSFNKLIRSCLFSSSLN